MAAQRTLGDARIDDVGCARLGGECPHRARPRIIERLDIASLQQPGEECLSAPASPCLSDDRGGDGGNGAADEECPMSCPHAALAAICRNQRSRVVRDAHQALRRRVVPLRRDRSIAFFAHSSASARSPSLNAP